MPEWPEMDTYRRLLSPLVCGHTITAVDVNREKTINEPIGVFQAALIGRKVLFVERRGKYLLFHLDDGNRLLLHLMLGGWLYYGREPEKKKSEYQVICTFDNGERLFFGGLRLGFLHRLSAKGAQERLKELGPDPFDSRLTAPVFANRLSKRKGKLKPVLVDQKLVSGIGNCYADEICFDAQVLPAAAIPELKEETKLRLFASMRKVLEEAAANGGYMDRKFTEDDTFVGGHDERCFVYDREGEPCPRCGSPIRMDMVSSRKMFYCPSCQRPE
ncbi:bifunctional DNA-formamidopyrimidine glycosylase/DNA-(apurinic or apyrimidinic site) lyase [Cohnella thermotolerans]|uniref:bifunctional DNA-formamidopyrimidine glycosylase/DNA-(apurinic or apyrimidinic site) lyase n=1 Tax=Cohnella thermotolerans TaxID=329858 RepID=UPI0003F588B3|nr:bifunctional DNA-formamidopyrimidine glycosylase/DNA-(apurinic or apyrimidinic site) lyase [Cohnella thermotolerans]